MKAEYERSFRQSMRAIEVLTQPDTTDSATVLRLAVEARDRGEHQVELAWLAVLEGHGNRGTPIYVWRLDS